MILLILRAAETVLAEPLMRALDDELEQITPLLAFLCNFVTCCAAETVLAEPLTL